MQHTVLAEEYVPNEVQLFEMRKVQARIRWSAWALVGTALDVDAMLDEEDRARRAAKS